MPETKPVEYIKEALGRQETKEQIFATLLGQGFSVEQIQQAFTQHPNDPDYSHRRTVSIIVTFGALLIGAGIFSFIASNWAYMPRALKVFVIILAMLGAYAGGWQAEQKAFPKTGKALYLLGVIIYGAGIFLVAQMFHVTSNWPDGFILWMFGALAMAYALDSAMLAYLGIALGFIAVFSHPFVLFDAYRDPFLLTSSTLLVVTAAVTFYAGLRIRRKMPSDRKFL